LNITQKKIYQRLIEILPDLDKQEQNIIHELVLDHILGISEDLRIQKIMSKLGIDFEIEGGSGTT
jgi:hypothetical protein